MKGKAYKRTCILKGCNVKFVPLGPNHVACSWPHGIEYAKNALKKKDKETQKEWKKEKKKRKEKLKTRTDHLNELQVLFNRFVRLRDAGKPCISCNGKLGPKYDCGHYYSVGAYPELRLHEYNAHGQCVACNQHKHGNLIAYGENLPKRIGMQAMAELIELVGTSLKLTLPEIIEKKEYYKTKIKQFNQ